MASAPGLSGNKETFTVFGLKEKKNVGWDGIAAAILSIKKKKRRNYCTIQGVSGGSQAALSPGQPLALGTKLPKNHNFIAIVCSTVVNAK